MSQENKFCPQCGQELSVESKFCPECGHAFAAGNEEAQPVAEEKQAVQQAQRTTSQPSTATQSSKKFPLPVALLVGFIALLLVGGYFLFFNSELQGTWVATHGSDTYNMEISRDDSVEWTIDAAGAVEIEMHFDLDYNESTEQYDMEEIHYLSMSVPTSELRDIEYEEFSSAGFEYEESGGRTTFYTENITDDVINDFLPGFPSISFEKAEDIIIGYADGDPLEFHPE